MSKDIPIIFSGPMVRALLDGRKTQTRRLAWGKSRPMPKAMPRGNLKMSIPGFKVNGGTYSPASPWQKVKPGDRLWVRENWRAEARFDFTPPNRIATSAPIYYEAGGGGEEAIPECAGNQRPSIHMPRWASRLTLSVEAVKVERLQDISERDAIREGLINKADHTFPIWTAGEGFGEHVEFPRDAFRELWESLHGADSWTANPEVCALSFRCIRKNIDQVSADD